MKKQILTLSVCLALSATSVMAAPATTSLKTAAKAPVAVTKTVKTPVVKTSKKVTTVVKKAVTPEVTVTPEELAKQKFEERMANERNNFYNKIGLSAEQKAKAESLDKANRESAAPLFNNVRTEKAKLHELKAKKAGFIAIYKQERNVKAAKKALRAHMDASRKQFE